MAHKRRNGTMYWRSKRARHNALGSRGREKSQFSRDFTRKGKRKLELR
jgi:hypothetical protein